MINWGILGLGRMGLTFANSIEETSNSKLIGIASKSGKKFKNFENQTYENLIKLFEQVSGKKMKIITKSSNSGIKKIEADITKINKKISFGQP